MRMQSEFNASMVLRRNNSLKEDKGKLIQNSQEQIKDTITQMTIEAKINATNVLIEHEAFKDNGEQLKY